LQKVLTGKFPLGAAYVFDGKMQTLAQWLTQEIPGIAVQFDTVAGTNNQPECDVHKSNVKITWNQSKASNKEVFTRLETKLKSLQS
jgi:hypothetical protein